MLASDTLWHQHLAERVSRLVDALRSPLNVSTLYLGAYQELPAERDLATRQAGAWWACGVFGTGQAMPSRDTTVEQATGPRQCVLCGAGDRPHPRVAGAHPEELEVDLSALSV